MCLMMLEAANIATKAPSSAHWQLNFMFNMSCKLHIFVGAANVTVGSTCKANGDCSPIPNDVCNNTCQCSPHYFVPSSNKAKCLASKHIF